MIQGKRDTARITSSCLIVSAIYFCMVIWKNPVEMFFSCAIMSIALFITLRWIYNYNENIFSISNLLIIIFLLIGMFTRFAVIIYIPEEFMGFAPYPLEDISDYHTRTALCLTLFLSMWAIAKNTAFTTACLCSDSVSEVEKNCTLDLFDSDLIKVVYAVLFFVSFIYKFANATSSTDSSYGTLDNLFNSIYTVVEIMSYIALVAYTRHGKIRNLILFITFFLPTIALNLIEAWKSGIIFQILLICIVLNEGKFKIKARYVVLLAVSLFFAYPIISIIRENTIYGYGTEINLKTIVNYNIENNILMYYSNRFAYYDETYYVLNTNISDITAFQNEAGSILARFFSGLIPRALWANKPIVNVGSSVTYTLLHYPAAIYNNLSVGMISDVYLSYSYVGIGLLGFILGKVLRKLENHKSRKKSDFRMAVYLAYGLTFIKLMEGDIATKCISLVITFIAILLLKILFIAVYKEKAYEQI